MKISVVIPTYNRRKYLRDLLDSIYQNDFDNNEYEVIVVDDGSQDDTISLLEEYKNKYKNFRYFIQKHKGASAARNLGIKNAKGEIIAFTDSDCIVNKNWLKEIVKSFEKPEIVGVCGKIISKKEKITPFTHQVIDEEGVNFITSNVAYKKEYLEKVKGFDEYFDYGMDDTDLYLRIQKLGKLVSNKNMIVLHQVILLNFLKFVKRMKIEFLCQIKFCQKHPWIYKNRDAMLTTLWIRGILTFIEGLKLHKKWIFKNPLVFVEYILALILQRFYLVYLCIKYKLNENFT